MQSKLEHILHSMELFQKVYPEDVGMILIDTEKVLHNVLGKKIKFPVKEGDLVSNYRGTVIEIALTTRRAQFEERGPEVFGFSYVTKAEPIFDNGKLIGAIAVSYSIEKYEILKNESFSIAKAVETMSLSSSELAVASNDVAKSVEELSTESSQMLSDIREIQNILQFVHEVATQSNLLGINASIEAARAGEHGRGFGVVATEIRKMSDSSKKSADTIRKQLEHIQDSVNTMNETIHQLAAFTEEHSASLRELNSSFIQLNKTAEKLQNLK